MENEAAWLAKRDSRLTIEDIFEQVKLERASPQSVSRPKLKIVDLQMNSNNFKPFKGANKSRVQPAHISLQQAKHHAMLKEQAQQHGQKHKHVQARSSQRSTQSNLVMQAPAIDQKQRRRRLSKEIQESSCCVQSTENGQSDSPMLSAL